MSQEETKARNDIKPFCPIHHWRMAHDAGSTKVGPSYRCSYRGCIVRYTPAQGYFELNNSASTQNFVLHAEILCCTYNPQHYPAIVGYAKESIEAFARAIRASRVNDICPRAGPERGT
jgi:hypothetical protein